MFGWFSNSLPGYPETLSLKCMLHARPGGLRPLIELEATDHPLSVAQRQGIPFQQAADYVHAPGGLSRPPSERPLIRQLRRHLLPQGEKDRKAGFARGLPSPLAGEGGGPEDRRVRGRWRGRPRTAERLGGAVAA